MPFTQDDKGFQPFFYDKHEMFRWFRRQLEAHVTSDRQPAAFELLDFLWKDGSGSFFVAPASSKRAFHFSEVGGLAMHTRNVIGFLLDQVESVFGGQVPGLLWGAIPDPSAQNLAAWRESAVLVGLCHDLNKTVFFGVPRYEVNMVMAKDRKSKVQSEAMPYEHGPNDPSDGDDGRPALSYVESLLVALVGGGFTSWRADELQAVLFIEGKYNYDFRTIEDRVFALTIMAHAADMFASHIVERGKPQIRGQKRLDTGFTFPFLFADPEPVTDPMDQPSDLATSEF